MQLMGIFFQCASHSGDVLCIPSLGVQVNLKRNRCLSVMWGSSCIIPPGLFSFLNCYLPLLLFLSWNTPFPPCLLEKLKLGLPAGCPVCTDCAVVCRLLRRKAWSEGVAVEQFLPSTPGPQKPAQEVLCGLISLI